MASDMEHQSQPQPRCCSTLYTIIDVRQRHFCAGGVILCLAIGIIIAESQQPSHFYAGYWMGSMDIFAALVAFVCAAKPHRITFATAAFFNAICAVLNGAGSIHLLAGNLNYLYTAGWLGIVQMVFLIYHCLSCIYDANVCCRWKALDEIESASTSAATATTTEADGSGQIAGTAATTNRDGGQRQDRRRRRTQSPPIDFRLPDEVPKLPRYDELSKSEGLPPGYDSFRINSSAFSSSRSVQ
ncbi:hypothetical protein ECG_02901 [Echinococcus granulosus]|uniref:Expressed conserved protein n=1 Tax=Echinococcus granulosus TaxID=6210 RepID=U6J7X5_ECHGR|nr:hypothetical protein EGR_01858 [Echinococcus granulosus]EUB63367.1 hypothetical protein EGR_01858 [Echinococcus granulosus]KAH9285124.1 hypothetical protein ECG_02901 [Echinococcus granulosus]CDS20136.1 expressed conserved protein [Echinococcus granulosus]